MLRVEEPVPLIRVSGRRVRSEAARPRHVADVCAAWDDADRERGRKLLLAKPPQSIYCEDATAHAAMLALSLEMMYSGRHVGAIARLVKVWEAADERS